MFREQLWSRTASCGVGISLERRVRTLARQTKTATDEYAVIAESRTAIAQREYAQPEQSQPKQRRWPRNLFESKRDSRRSIFDPLFPHYPDVAIGAHDRYSSRAEYQFALLQSILCAARTAVRLGKVQTQGTNRAPSCWVVRSEARVVGQER
jgi:hypothetical protein